MLGREGRGSGRLVTDRVSVLVSLRFEISCVLLHFSALRLMAKPLRLQDNATRCAQVRRWCMRLRVSCSTMIRKTSLG